MDRDYWINRPKFYDPFIEDTMYNCYFQWWQAHQWIQWCIV